MDWSGSFAFVFLFHALFLCSGPFWQLIIRFVQFRSRRVGQCSTPSTASTAWMILISLSRVWYYTALPSETKSRIVISAALSWKSVCGWGELDRSRSVFVLIKYTASEDTLRGMRCLLVCVCLHPISWGETWNRWDRREPFRHQWRSYGLQDERSLVYSSIISCMCKLWSTTGNDNEELQAWEICWWKIKRWSRLTPKLRTEVEKGMGELFIDRDWEREIQKFLWTAVQSYRHSVAVCYGASIHLYIPLSVPVVQRVQ